MNIWQTEIMEENARNRMWEELNEPDVNEGRRAEAVSCLTVAMKHLSTAWDFIYKAVDEVDGLPEADEIESFLEEVISIKTGLSGMQDKLNGKGW